MQGRIDYVDINTSALCDKYMCEDCPENNSQGCIQAWNYYTNGLEECQIYAEGEQ